MSEPIDPQKAVDFLLTNARPFAQAKAERVYLEAFLKSKRALLMQASEQSSAAMQERDAYAHPEYQELIAGLRAAVEREETLRWKMVAAQTRVDVWRSQEASNRGADKTTR